MAWIDPVSRSTGFDVTAAVWDQDVVINPLILRAGGIAIAGQVASRIPYASGASQLATSASLTWDGTSLTVGGNIVVTSGVLSLNGTGFIRTDVANTLAMQSGTAGYLWRNSAASVDLMSLSNAGLLSVNGSGAHAFSAAGPNGIAITGTGTSQYAYQQVIAGSVTGGLTTFAQSWSTSGTGIQASTRLSNDGAGGITIEASHAAGVFRGCSGGATQRFQYDPNGNYVLGSGTAITDGVGTPTIASGFGGSSTIAGKSYGFRITHGSGTSTSGVVNFGTTYASAPAVVASSPIGDAVTVTATTTQATITSSGASWAASDVINVLVRGF